MPLTESVAGFESIESHVGTKAVGTKAVGTKDSRGRIMNLFTTQT